MGTGGSCDFSWFFLLRFRCFRNVEPLAFPVEAAGDEDAIDGFVGAGDDAPLLVVVAFPEREFWFFLFLFLFFGCCAFVGSLVAFALPPPGDFESKEEEGVPGFDGVPGNAAADEADGAGIGPPTRNGG